MSKKKNAKRRKQQQRAKEKAKRKRLEQEKMRSDGGKVKEIVEGDDGRELNNKRGLTEKELKEYKKNTSKVEKSERKKKSGKEKKKEKVTEGVSVENKTPEPFIAEVPKEALEEKKEGFFKKVKKYSKEYDSMVKGDMDKLPEGIQPDSEETNVETKEESMVVRVALCISIAIVSVCMVAFVIFFIIPTIYTNLRGNLGIKDIVCTADKVYQYQQVEAKDFACVPSSLGIGELKPITELSAEYGAKVLSTYYNDKYASICVNNHVYAVECPLEEAEDVYFESEHIKCGFAFTDKEWEDLSKNDLKGYVKYSDTVLPIDIQSISVEKDGNKKYLKITAAGGVTYNYTPEKGFK